MYDTDYALRAAIARERAISRGYADCIHYAPNCLERADALYDAMLRLGIKPGSPALLADGRMVAHTDDFVAVELNNGAAA